MGGMADLFGGMGGMGGLMGNMMQQPGFQQQMAQMQQHLLLRKYDGFMKKTRIRGRRE